LFLLVLIIFIKLCKMLSKKTRYGIMALSKLACFYDKGPIQISTIAESEKIPKRFLEGILLEMKRFGVVGSKSGKNGGYFLIKHPSHVHLSEIVNYFEGTSALLACTSDTMYQPCEFCRDEKSCKIKTVFDDVKTSIDSVLGNRTLIDIM